MISVAGLLLAANFFAFFAFWSDKRRALAGLRRVPERRLLAVALCGGSFGALCAQQIFRHKTRKQPFRSRLIMIACFHLLLLAGAMTPPAKTWMAGKAAALQTLLQAYG